MEAYMTTMVTGGNGFLGSRVVRRLAMLGEPVVCFARRIPETLLLEYPKLVTPVQGDITQLQEVLAAVQQNHVKRIIHMAAVLNPRAQAEPYETVQVNALGTSNVMEAARQVDTTERVVYASGINYHGLDQSFFGQRPLIEEDEPRPRQLYGLTKVLMEFLANSYTENYGLQTHGVRICTAFGHGRIGGVSAWSGSIVSLPAIGKSVHVPFSPNEPSAMIYVDDVAEIFARLALTQKLNHPVYFTGGELVTSGEFGQIVKSLLPDAEITFGDKPMPHIYWVDNRKLVEDIKFNPPPLRQRVLDHINEARREANISPISM